MNVCLGSPAGWGWGLCGCHVSAGMAGSGGWSGAGGGDGWAGAGVGAGRWTEAGGVPASKWAQGCTGRLPSRTVTLAPEKPVGWNFEVRRPATPMGCLGPMGSPGWARATEACCCCRSGRALSGTCLSRRVGQGGVPGHCQTVALRPLIPLPLLPLETKQVHK